MSTWDEKAGRVIYISYISHFVVRVQLADSNWWVVFNLSYCGLYLPLSATQPLSHRIQTNKNRKRHIPYAYMNNNGIVDTSSEVGNDDKCTRRQQVESACKGAYASVRPYRHTYGNYGIRLQTWTRVIVNRYIGKIIARDLSLVASQLYRMAVTLSPSLGADLLGCINRTREKERKGKKALYIPVAYVLVRNHKSRYRLVQLNGDLSAVPAHGETPHPLTGGKTPCRRHLYRAEIQRREEEKRETKHPKVIPSSIISTS
jgi:hypothetical protein